MAHIVKVPQQGGLEQLTLTHVTLAAPGPGEVRIQQHAIGVNPLDVSQRKGDVPLPTPAQLGLEGAGVVTAVGEGVQSFKSGDRVAYATGPLGAYASERNFPAGRLVKIANDLSFADAAAILFKGITAQYLLKATYPVAPGSQVLLYGASGGVGQLMAAWARHLGATVIGVVSRDSSVERALQAGCDHALVFDANKLATQVRDLTHGKGVDVVYDAVGKVSWEASLDSIRPRGLMVSFGMTSGAPAPVSVSTLNAKGALFLTRPSLAAHTATDAEYQERAQDVLTAVRQAIIKPNAAHTFSLADVQEAHRLMESGQNTGPIVLVP